MNLLKFAKACDTTSAEKDLLIRIYSINGENILGECKYGYLAEYVQGHGPDMKDWIVVEMTRDNLIPEDKDRPIWDKSILLRVV